MKASLLLALIVVSSMTFTSCSKKDDPATVASDAETVVSTIDALEQTANETAQKEQCATDVIANQFDENQEVDAEIFVETYNKAIDEARKQCHMSEEEMKVFMDKNEIKAPEIKVPDVKPSVPSTPAEPQVPSEPTRPATPVFGHGVTQEIAYDGAETICGGIMGMNSEAKIKSCIEGFKYYTFDQRAVDACADYAKYYGGSSKAIECLGQFKNAGFNQGVVDICKAYGAYNNREQGIYCLESYKNAVFYSNTMEVCKDQQQEFGKRYGRDCLYYLRNVSVDDGAIRDCQTKESDPAKVVSCIVRSK